ASGQCWVTGLATGSHLVGGPTHLISPVLDLSGAPEARLAFAAYFWRSFGLGDWLRVDLSNDGGATWVNIDAIPPDGAWVERLYRVADYLAPTASVRIQFRAENVTGIVKTEAAVDALRVLSYECRPCVADYNRDGEVNTIDFVTYLNDFTGATSLYDPDMNGDGEVNTLDFVIYLNAFNTGCE
ncbi:MAG TPA: GC-type dockerin domain-anchored protein, partial [Dehalococcoidia bacterium]|nr:GC-type dockerin domain-anchored protein [Dehalococcoidia bacterium]